MKISKSLIQKPTAKESTEPIEDALNNSIIGQPNAKATVADTVKRMRLNILEPKRPHSFLFAGPSGTGKTEMAKQLATYLYGSEKDMIRLDMSEFSEGSSISRIKGSPDGYVGSNSKQPLPFDTLQTNPQQVILLDEIEKAHNEIRLLFMQILDEGTLTTERHNTIDFSKAIIIATTNAGVAKLNTPTVGFNKPKEKTKSDIVDALKDDFPIELINRFEHIVAFNELTKRDYKQVMALKYNTMIAEAKRNRPDLNFSPMSIDMHDDDSLDMLNELADQTYDTKLNGRPAERSVRQRIEQHLMDNIDSVKQVIFEPITKPPLPAQPSVVARMDAE